MMILSAPIYYALELTPVCNHCCPGCGNVFARNRTPLSSSDWRHILKRIAPHVQILKLTGGEPTLHPEFASIIQAVAELGLPFTVFTNACWAEPDQIISLLGSVSYCSRLLVSLHGADVTGHETFTGRPGSFEETKANIRQAVRAGLRIHISTVITRWNWSSVREVVELGQELGARHIVFNRYIGLENRIEPDNSQLMSAVASITKLQRNGKPVKFGNCVPQCFISNSSGGCWAGRAYCTVDPWGNLRPCNHSPSIIGSVLQESIEDLWRSDVMNNWRALLPKQCETCSEVEVCHGGCLALAEIRGKDPLIHQSIQKECSYSPVELALCERERPKLQCSILRELFGYALVRGTTIVPVASQAKPILDTLDGCMTLRQIRDEFGQEVLDFIGSLCYHGLVEFEA